MRFFHEKRRQHARQRWQPAMQKTVFDISICHILHAEKPQDIAHISVFVAQSPCSTHFTLAHFSLQYFRPNGFVFQITRSQSVTANQCVSITSTFADIQSKRHLCKHKTQATALWHEKADTTCRICQRKHVTLQPFYTITALQQVFR